MLDLYNLIIAPPECKQYHWTYLKKWNGVNEILSEMKLHASVYDETGYFYAERENYCEPKLKAMRYFISRYGTTTDKKTFLPLLEFPRH
jgi:hypothetical protein